MGGGWRREEAQDLLLSSYDDDEMMYDLHHMTCTTRRDTKLPGPSKLLIDWLRKHPGDLLSFVLSFPEILGMSPSDFGPLLDELYGTGRLYLARRPLDFDLRRKALADEIRSKMDFLQGLPLDKRTEFLKELREVPGANLGLAPVLKDVTSQDAWEVMLAELRVGRGHRWRKSLDRRFDAFKADVKFMTDLLRGLSRSQRRNLRRKYDMDPHQRLFTTTDAWKMLKAMRD